MAKFYDVDQIGLPKDYRVHTYFADLEGPANIVAFRPDTNVLQFRTRVRAKLFGIPYWKHTWVDIGEVTPSICGLATIPVVIIYKKFEEHYSAISNALKETEFKVLLQENKSPT
jgi:hypothetical protein